MKATETALQQSPYTPRLCHNDLLNANFIDDGQIRILDWEYAGMGNPVFDLANFSVHHGFSDEQDRWLLESYFGEVTAANWARIKLLKIISDFREWEKKQQDAVDFRRIARASYDRVNRTHVRRLGDLVWEGGGEELERLLDIASKDEPFPM